MLKEIVFDENGSKITLCKDEFVHIEVSSDDGNEVFIFENSKDLSEFIKELRELNQQLIDQENSK